MFTGIIEILGTIDAVLESGTNRTFWVSSAISQELNVDQSISHNGVCLTVEDVKNNSHRVTAIDETLKKTNMSSLQKGSLVNLERCMTMNGRLDGHIVQGHVDTTAICLNVKQLDGSWEYRFIFPSEFSGLVIEKGSIAIDGTSLTLFNVSQNEFSVAIIPFTFEHTNFNQVVEGSIVNIEFDMIGKYVQRLLDLRQ